MLDSKKCYLSPLVEIFRIILWINLLYTCAVNWVVLQVLHQVEHGFRMQQPQGCPPALYDIMLECWHKVQTSYFILSPSSQFNPKYHYSDIPPIITPSLYPFAFL